MVKRQFMGSQSDRAEPPGVNPIKLFSS